MHWSHRVFIEFQRLIPRRALTRLMYRLTRIRFRPIKNLTIRGFIAWFAVDVEEIENDVPDGYLTFNDFFTRALRAGARQPDPDPDALVSPCDGTISQIGRIGNNRLLQAKGNSYTLEELLGGDAALAQRFANGRFATIYLAPYDYHRVHMPIEGTLRRECHVGHDLFSVNKITVDNIRQLFVRNERLITLYDTELGPVAVILVGALNVGSITTVWSGEWRGGLGTDGQWLAQQQRLAKGELLGWFNMGSTVIVLCPDDALEWEPRLEAGDRVRTGERLGTVFRRARHAN